MDAVMWHNLEWTTKGALDFVDGHSGDGRPFFLCMATTTIHAPDHVESLLCDPRLTCGGYCDDHLGVQASRRSIYDRLRNAPGVDFNHITAGVLWMDDALGAVLRRVRELGLEDDTVVIVSTDHGPSVGGKFTLYQAGVRIPFALQWKGGIEGGQVIDELAQNVDLLPTLLDMAGVDLPDGMAVDGTSLLPLMIGGEPGGQTRDDLYFEFGYARAVRTERWKYIAWRLPESILAPLKTGEADCLPTHFGRPIPADVLGPNLITPTMLRYPHYFDPDQLYDLATDPDERDNLAYNPEYAWALEEMKGRLRRHLATFSDPFDLDSVDPWHFSPRCEKMKGRLRERFEKERPPWEADSRFIGLSQTEPDAP
jgi:hypothetical protein